jgi:hypothetical protein
LTVRLTENAPSSIVTPFEVGHANAYPPDEES